MKRCGKCREYKPAADFAWRDRKRGTLNSYCKPCQREFCKAHYQFFKPKHNRRRHDNNRVYIKRNQTFVTEYLRDHPCIDCGEADPVVLEFDHVLGQKHSALSEMVRNAAPLARIREEILKCEVRCANCHRRKTAKQLRWYKVVDSGM